MNDNSLNTVAGIMILGEQQRQANNARLAREAAEDEKTKQLSNKNAQISSEKNKIEKENSFLAGDVNMWRARAKHFNLLFVEEREERNKLIDENAYYKTLLSKPMLEIAEANGDFKKTYEMQMEFVAEWMVSQKAFKELAIEFGAEKGFDKDKVIQMGLDKEIDVLESNHDESHRTNADKSTIISPHIEKLKAKFHKDRKK